MNIRYCTLNNTSGSMNSGSNTHKTEQVYIMYNHTNKIEPSNKRNNVHHRNIMYYNKANRAFPLSSHNKTKQASLCLHIFVNIYFI